MSDDIKFIVTELNKSPFNKNYNLISFDSLSSEDLLQVVTDVLAEVDAANKVDVRTEEPEQTAIRLLTMLRVLKYKPGSDINAAMFRQGLVQADKQIIHPILNWVLCNLQDLKKRAYLAQYLVKIDVPIEILGDADIANLYEQYERLIDEFKSAHKESESMKQSGNTTAELRADIDSIDKERDIVLKKIERMLRKIENISNKEAMIEASHELRVERERKKEIANQKQNESIAAHQTQQRLTLLSQQLRELRQASLGATSEGLIQRLEEEANMTSYIAKQKLPREIEQRKREVDVLQSVVSDVTLNRNNVDALHAKIQAVSSEVNQLVEQHLQTSNPVDDKLAPFRQQAAIIARKKDSIAEEFAELKGKLNKLQEEIQEKQEAVREAGGGGGILRGEDFKRYVSKLRARSTVYKKHRAELAQLKAEGGVLARTLDILKAKQNELSESGDNLQGLQNQPQDVKGHSREELATLVSQLLAQISSRKAQLAPLINDLRPLREKVQEMTATYDEQKRIYDRTAAALDSGSAKLEQEVRGLREEQESAESQRTLLSAKSIILQVRMQRVSEEMRLYIEKGTTQSLREKLSQRITEQERISRQLKEEQTVVRETQEKSKHQRQIWTNLKELLECKKQCMEEAQRNYGILHLEKGAETLVLQ
ncbi:intraflagellar transport protein 81 homolog [Lycorma delicatula]|uniref:intraflagellar transport protein 81 homolog n=1 Tax=Lycorma delicatula TaxID=130591 RepID=UPI003F519174